MAKLPPKPQISREEFNRVRHAFATRAPGDRPAMFRTLADTLVPGLFEWHSWTNKIIEAGCRYRWCALSGCSNCVDGDTRILDPITGDRPTIKYLCENKITPMVMTLDGPRRAGVPFIKGSAELIEIVLENGSRFSATAEHVVLSANGFVSVKSLYLGQALFAYAQCRPASTLEPCQSVHVLSDRNSLQTIADSRGDCRFSHLICDGQLRLAREACQSSFPLPDGAPIHTQHDFGADDQWHEDICNQAWKHAPHPSIAGCDCRHNSSGILVSHHDDPAIDERGDHLCQPSSLSLLESDCLLPFEEPIRDFWNKLSSSRKKYSPPPISKKWIWPCDLSEGSSQYLGYDGIHAPSVEFSHEKEYKDLEALSTDSSHDLSALAYMVAQSRIASITKIGTGKFYDISVPGPEHYFAEGIIHHNSAKTFNTAGFACVWWLAAPDISSVIFCSTTMKMLRKRGWAEVQRFHKIIGGDFGNLVDSRTVWQASPGNDKCAIFGKAVCEGDVNKAAADIQGIHTKRQLVIIDEAEAVPAAIWKACANLYGYCVDVGGEFVLMALANARSRLSQFGRFIEPENGWDSVSVDSDDWLSKPQMDGKKAIVLRFDFTRSPNITEGKVVSRHLPTKHRVEGRLAALKARGGENDPDHWTYDRGFPVPEGLLKTVFTDSLITKHDGYGKHKFLGTNFKIIGAFDQAFGGGDRPALRFGAMGDIEGNKTGIEWMEAIILYLDATSSEPVRYQLKNKLKACCENVQYRGQTYQCQPEDLAIDCTGDGGLADICHQEWSAKINRVIFSESASDSPVSQEDERPSKEVFLNKRVEMYFRTRDALMAGQIKGIDKDTAAELCNLEELVEKADGTVRPRKTLQSKKDYKLKYQISPDLSDSAVLLTEVARLKGFSVAAVGLTVNRSYAMDEMMKKSQAVYDEGDFFSANNNDFIEEDAVM